MRIGITGARGFIGWHMQCFLKTIAEEVTVTLAGREEFSSAQALENFIRDVDVVFHFAGVNRADDQLLHDGNIKPAELLVEALKAANALPVVVYSSTTHAENTNSVYGAAKNRVAQVFTEWASLSGGNFQEVIIPHVFGEYGRPHYNSATNTFCSQIANGQPPSVTRDGELELVHVQDLVEQLYDLGVSTKLSGVSRIRGHKIRVSDVAERLQRMFCQYAVDGIVPDLSDDFEKSLFNSLRSYIPTKNRKNVAVKHSDERGWLVETVRVSSGGQSFVSTTKPGVTRGNHFHRKKFERFFVLQGKASICMRKLGSAEVEEFIVESGAPGFIDIPTLYTHNITNIGSDELITFFWTNEIFDPDNPDTYFEVV